jgi:hypothetical protein
VRIRGQCFHRFVLGLMGIYRIAVFRKTGPHQIDKPAVVGQHALRGLTGGDVVIATIEHDRPRGIGCDHPVEIVIHVGDVSPTEAAIEHR